MSDLLNANFGFSSDDKYTNFIVNGYMKIPPKSYYSHLRDFAKDITTIAIDYIGDHFMMHRGSYQWNIDNELLMEMCNAENAEKFESDTFEMANLKWKLIAYPKGEWYPYKSFILTLNLNSMPFEWEELHLCCRLTQDTLE